MCYVMLHVDDMGVLMPPDGKERDRVRGILEEKYERLAVQDGQKVKYIGLEIEWNRGAKTAKVGMSKRVAQMAKDFAIDPVTRRMENPATCRDFSKPETEDVVLLGEKEVTKFRSLVMTLAYISAVFPEIKYHVGHLATRQSKPSKRDFRKAIHVAHYVIQHKDNVMNIHGVGENPTVIVYTDASFDVYADSKSHGGVVVFVGEAGCAMYATSHKQHCMTRSSTDSEIVEAECGVFLGGYFRDVMEELGIVVGHLQYQDNASAIALVKSGVRDYSRRERHMIRRVNFTKEYFGNTANRAEFVWIGTALMVADILTKDLHGEAFEMHTCTLHGESR